MKTTASFLAASAFAAAACAAPCLSEEEAAFMARGTQRIEMIPGTPESDALRFYSSTQRNEYVEFNYDESKAGELGKDYTLEDPLAFADGRKVTKATWPERRREILDLFEREVYGRLPPKPGEMVFEISSEKMSEDRFATIRRYRQFFRSDRTGPAIDWLVVLPRHAKGPVPVFLHLNYAGLDKVEAKKTNHYDLPWDMLVAHGYAFMSAKYTQICGDGGKRGGIFNGVCELWGMRDFAKTDNPGSLMIWAWGLMRGLDLAGKIPEIDARRNVVIGSSRLGKAALLAAAYDERFTVCVPNQTGAVGVQLMKRNYGETVKGQRLSLPHWYCRNVWKYADAPRSQQFDQHLLLACVAPRALLLECYHKKWFDPKGEWLAAKAASPVWKMLTGKSLGGGERAPETWPDPYSETAAVPPFGYVRRTECHGLSPYDWKWAVDFADRALSATRGRKAKVVTLSFDSVPGETPMDVICGARAELDAAVRRQRSAHFVLRALPSSGPNRVRNALVNRELRKFCDGRKYFWNAEGGEEAPASELSVSRVTAANQRWTNGVFGVRWWLSRVAAGRSSIAGAKGELDLVMLGDSVTHFWETKHADSWAAFTNGLRVASFGCAGDKVANAIWMAENGALDGVRTKAVSIMIGTNDNTSDSSDPAEVARRIEKLVGLVREKQPGAKILLYAVFPRGNSARDAKHLAPRRRNEATNARLAAFAASVPNLVYVDLSASYLGPDGFVPKTLMADGIHPTAAGYSIWAESLRRGL